MRTCGLQARSAFDPPEADRREASSQVASLNLVGHTMKNAKSYDLAFFNEIRSYGTSDISEI